MEIVNCKEPEEWHELVKRVLVCRCNKCTLGKSWPRRDVFFFPNIDNTYTYKAKAWAKS